MMKHITRGGLIAVTAFISSHCEPPQEPTRPPQVIIVGEDYNHPFDARPGDRIILVMNPDSKEGMTARCDHSGGRLNYNFATDIWHCEDVDF